MALTRTELDNLKRIASQAGFSKWTYVTADSEFYHAFCPPTALALIARIEALEAEIAVSDKLIAERNRVLDRLACPVHGRCVPFALDRIEALERVAEAARVFAVSDCCEGCDSCTPGLIDALMALDKGDA